MMELLTIFTTAFVTENLFFARAFDCGSQYHLNRDPKKLLLFGGISTAMLALSGPIAYAVNRLISATAWYNYINGLCHLLVLILVYVVASFLLQKYAEKHFAVLSKYLHYATFNCATLGSLLLSAKDAELDSLGKVLAYHIGAGAGFTCALLLIWSLRQRLGSCHAPKAFRGLPLQLITAGFIALALVGLTGNQLPA